MINNTYQMSQITSSYANVNHHNQQYNQASPPNSCGTLNSAGKSHIVGDIHQIDLIFVFIVKILFKLYKGWSI